MSASTQRVRKVTCIRQATRKVLETTYTDLFGEGSFDKDVGLPCRPHPQPIPTQKPQQP